MIALCRFALIVPLLGNAAFAADPLIDLRLLRMDQKTAGLLEKALQDESTTSAKIEDKLDTLVKGGTLTELARFRKQFDTNGGIMSFEKDRADIKVADGEVLPGGISLEAEAIVGPSGWVDLRLALNRSVSEGLNRIHTERTNTSTILKSDQWEIISDWGDERRATLLLVRFSGTETKDTELSGRVADVRFRSELRWCEPADLKTFGRATEETRIKATAWLLGKSKPIATSGIRVRGGLKCVQENLLEWIHDANGWDTAQLGWSLEYSNSIGADGKPIDLQLMSRWHPLDAKRPPATPDFSYEYAATIPTGTTTVIEPKTRPDIGPVPVIFLTPTLLTLAEGEKPLYAPGLPKEGDLAIITYPVHPSLMRKLSALAAPDPKADPHGPAGPNLRDMLQNMGMDFPAGTTVSFDASQGHVVLVHQREGHQRFRAILEQNGLSVKVEDKVAP